MADTNTYDLFQKVEKWTTKDNFNKLDPRTIETGTEYNLAGAIEETDLGSDLQTKINGKLTAPTTPTAESAVTMLADGTVATKPLSEIGGGKLYRHDITIYYNNQMGIISSAIYNRSDSLIENIGALGNYRSPWAYNSYQASGSVFVEFHPSQATFDVKGVVCKRSDTTVYVVLEEGMTVNQFSDIVTEV